MKPITMMTMSFRTWAREDSMRDRTPVDHAEHSRYARCLYCWAFLQLWVFDWCDWPIAYCQNRACRHREILNSSEG